MENQLGCTAFAGSKCLASGALAEVAVKTKEAIDAGEQATVLIFDDDGRPIEIDFRGTPADVLKRLAQTYDVGARANPDERRGPGRPKLGVVAREVTLLPRHWDWLNGQPGGASVVLRRLVDEARRANEGSDRVRRAQEAAYRFMSAMAGDLAGFEEAARALFARSVARFDQQVESWPADIRDHAKRLAAVALEQLPAETTQ
jgi:uncharacterized protein